MIVIGHDPGCTGALVVLCANDGEAWCMDYFSVPTTKIGKRSHVKVDALYRWMKMYSNAVMFSERVGPISCDTPTTAWSFSAANQAVLTLASVLDYTTHDVTPGKWHRAILHGMPMADRDQIKNSAVEWAREAYPALVPCLRLKKSSDIADAACIAELGRRLIKANKV